MRRRFKKQGVGESGRPRLPWKQETGGSNPPTLTIQTNGRVVIKIFGDHDEKTVQQLWTCSCESG